LFSCDINAFTSTSANPKSEKTNAEYQAKALPRASATHEKCMKMAEEMEARRADIIRKAEAEISQKQAHAALLKNDTVVKGNQKRAECSRSY
jgi:hypothetical protein